MMPSRAVMKSVLHGFLGTLRSRHSEHEGFWLFGFLVPELLPLEVDLRESGSDAAGVEASFDRRAKWAFTQQLHKHGFTDDAVEEAGVSVAIVAPAHGMRGGLRAQGFVIRATVRVVVDSGREYRDDADFFVAAHDASLELRSKRARTP